MREVQTMAPAFTMGLCGLSAGDKIKLKTSLNVKVKDFYSFVKAKISSDTIRKYNREHFLKE